MFSYMADVLAWCVVISFIAFGFAFAAEGRGVHVLRVVLGLAPRKHGLDAFTSVPRDEGDWRLVEMLDDTRQPEPSVNAEVRREHVLPRAS